MGDALLRLCGSCDKPSEYITVTEISKELKAQGYEEYTVRNLQEMRWVAECFPPHKRMRGGRDGPAAIRAMNKLIRKYPSN